MKLNNLNYPYLKKLEQDQRKEGSLPTVENYLLETIQEIHKLTFSFENETAVTIHNLLMNKNLIGELITDE